MIKQVSDCPNPKDKSAGKGKQKLLAREHQACYCYCPVSLLKLHKSLACAKDLSKRLGKAVSDFSSFLSTTALIISTPYGITDVILDQSNSANWD